MGKQRNTQARNVKAATAKVAQKMPMRVRRQGIVRRNSQRPGDDARVRAIHPALGSRWNQGKQGAEMTTNDKIAGRGRVMESAYRKDLHFGGSCLIPKKIAVCPQCGDKLAAECASWETESGSPAVGSVYVSCMSDHNLRHRYNQGDWQPVINAVENWCGAVDI